jgi:outer membrane protein assembly factor BamB
MREDFVTRLQVQLREAAEREERRGPIRRAARSGRAPAIAVAALALLAGAVLAAGGWLRGTDSAPAGDDGLRVLSATTFGPLGGQLVSGFGSVWLADPTGNVLRVDPRTGRVVGRIPAGQDIRQVIAGAGAVWAMGPAGEVLRIDPASDRIVARMSLPFSDVGTLMIAQDTVWILIGPEVWRVDRERNVLEPRIGFMRGGPGPRSGASDGTSLYGLRPDRIVERHDGSDGHRIGSVRLALPGAVLAAADGKLLLARDYAVAAVDARDGRALWQRELGIVRVNQALVAGRSLWVHGSPMDGGRDRVWRLDLSSGRVRDALTLPDDGASGMAVVGDRLWIATPDGRLQIVGR